MNNKPNEWEQNIIDNAVEYSIMEWRPLDKSTKTIVKTYDEAKSCTIKLVKIIRLHWYMQSMRLVDMQI